MGEMGGMHRFLLQFNSKVSGGGAAAYLDFIMQKISFTPGSFRSIVFVTSICDFLAILRLMLQLQPIRILEIGWLK